MTAYTTLQLPFAGIVMPANCTRIWPAVITAPVAPLQVPVTEPLFVVGPPRRSVKEAPVNAKLLLLESVKVTLEVPPLTM